MGKGGLKCETCGTLGHVKATCWQEHPELKPAPRKKVQGVDDEGGELGVIEICACEISNQFQDLGDEPEDYPLPPADKTSWATRSVTAATRDPDRENFPEADRLQKKKMSKIRSARVTSGGWSAAPDLFVPRPYKRDVHVKRVVVMKGVGLVPKGDEKPRGLLPDSASCCPQGTGPAPNKRESAGCPAAFCPTDGPNTQESTMTTGQRKATTLDYPAGRTSWATRLVTAAVD